MKTAQMIPAAAITALLLVTACKPKTDAEKAASPTIPAPAPTPSPETTAPRTEAATNAGTAVGNAASDAAITTKVKAALADDAGLKTLKLDVDTKDGNVTITGTVKSADLKGNITTIAQKVEGVKTVTNNVEVKA